jgi:hypothetical protein
MTLRWRQTDAQYYAVSKPAEEMTARHGLASRQTKSVAISYYKNDRIASKVIALEKMK